MISDSGVLFLGHPVYSAICRGSQALTNKRHTGSVLRARDVPDTQVMQ